MDEDTAWVESYGGALASLSASIATDLVEEAVISGSAGRIVVPLFHAATTASLHTAASVTERSAPLAAHGFEYQIREVERCLAQGLTESPAMTWAQSLEMAQAMDTIRAQIGVRYPFD